MISVFNKAATNFRSPQVIKINFQDSRNAITAHCLFNCHTHSSSLLWIRRNNSEDINIAMEGSLSFFFIIMYLNSSFRFSHHLYIKKDGNKMEN